MVAINVDEASAGGRIIANVAGLFVGHRHQIDVDAKFFGNTNHINAAILARCFNQRQ